MLSPIKEYFVCTRSERNGTILLIILIIFFFVIPHYYYLIFPKKVVIDYSEFEQQIAYLNSDSSNLSKKTNWRNKTASIKELFYFDPNTASFQDFRQLGLSGKLANTIINYREKGGKFYQKEDLKKIYGFRQEDYLRLANYMTIGQEKPAPLLEKKSPGKEVKLITFDPNTATIDTLKLLGLSDKLIQTINNYRTKGGKFNTKEDLLKIYGLKRETYLRLAPYILINESLKEEFVEKKIIIQPTVSTPLIIDINLADAATFKQLYGIGNTYANRIIKFRNALGGFISINQIAETYGLPDSTYQNIKSQLKVSPLIQKINANTASYQVLVRHPYISKSVAQAIVNYRKQHQSFHDFEALRTMLNRFNSLDKDRIIPYLEI